MIDTDKTPDDEKSPYEKIQTLYDQLVHAMENEAQPHLAAFLQAMEAADRSITALRELGFSVDFRCPISAFAMPSQSRLSVVIPKVEVVANKGKHSWLTSSQLAQEIATVAFQQYANDQERAEQFIDEIVDGETAWSETVRKLAKVIYLIEVQKTPIGRMSKSPVVRRYGHLYFERSPWHDVDLATGVARIPPDSVPALVHKWNEANPNQTFARLWFGLGTPPADWDFGPVLTTGGCVVTITSTSVLWSSVIGYNAKVDRVAQESEIMAKWQDLCKEKTTVRSRLINLVRWAQTQR